MHNRSLLPLLFVLPLTYSSCKKDEDRKLIGVYQGIARVVERIPGNTSLNKDTLYTNVLFTLDRGSESTRKRITLTLNASPSVAGLSPENNLPVDNGIVNSYASVNLTVLTWTGQIRSDSMVLTSSYIWVSGGNRREIFIKARKQ